MQAIKATLSVITISEQLSGLFCPSLGYATGCLEWWLLDLTILQGSGITFDCQLTGMMWFHRCTYLWMCVDTHTQQACLKHNYLKMILVKQSIDSIAIIMITAQVAGNNLYTYIYIQVYMYTHLHIHMHIYNIYTLTSTSWWGSEMRLMNNESLMALMAVTSVVLTGCMHHIHTCLCFDVCM